MPFDSQESLTITTKEKKKVLREGEDPPLVHLQMTFPFALPPDSFRENFAFVRDSRLISFISKVFSFGKCSQASLACTSRVTLIARFTSLYDDIGSVGIQKSIRNSQEKKFNFIHNLHDPGFNR